MVKVQINCYFAGASYLPVRIQIMLKGMGKRALAGLPRVLWVAPLQLVLL